MTRVRRPKREDLEIEHQSGVFRVGGGNSHGTIKVGKVVIVRVGLGLLNPPLDFAHGFQILTDPSPIGRAKLFLEARDFLVHGIQQAGPLL